MAAEVETTMLMMLRDARVKAQPAPSITEMSMETGKSLAWIHDRLQFLASKGMVNTPPKPNMARGYSITKAGEQYLQMNGLIPTPIWETD